MRPEAFALAILDLCFAFGGSVTSWVRTRARNELVGGVAHSAHLLGLAVDIVWDEPPDLAVLAARAGRLGLRIHHEQSHDHIEADFTAPAPKPGLV